MPKLAFPPNNNFKKGFTVNQVAEKHGWPESLVWAVKLEGKDDAAKYRVAGQSSFKIQYFIVN
ncbi:MAG: hypothetical protein PVG39_13445 [Desulfobacteraceae bacterium]|jgi:hypothetical protein